MKGSMSCSWKEVVGRVIVLLVVTAVNANVSHCRAEGRVGFLTVQTSPDKMGPEARAAYKLARELRDAALVVFQGGGKFADQGGKSLSLDAFDVLWYHQGDSAAQSSLIYDSGSIGALRKYVEGGRNLFLSGAALPMVHKLKIEEANPRVGPPGNDTSKAMLQPIQDKHPIFAQLQFSGGKVFLSDRGHPAFSDFHGTGGPAGGMLLAQTGGSENGLVEYESGKGRVIVMGWRLPHYSNSTNAHRANLERLTGNILAYLGDKKQWRKVVVKPVRLRATGQPVVSAERQLKSLELAVRDLIATHGPRYLRGADYLKRIDLLKDLSEEEIASELPALKSEALLANPLLDFEGLIVVKRKKLALPTNYQSNSSLRPTGHDNQLAVLSPVRPEGKLSTLFQPEGGKFVGDVDLHFDAKKVLFSMPGANGRWQLHELDVDGRNLRELATIKQADVDNYDACYLPDGQVVFTSTAPFVGVPCVRGSSHVANLYLRNTEGSVRQLTVDQEHNWCPTVLNDGRVMYLRWEYADTPHAFYRILFQMNPDGTQQAAYYGSNSYWPNAMFFARPVPNHPTKFVAVVGGHHAPGRTGELILFDATKGRYEADGVVQRIPGYGKKVEPVIVDGLAAGSWPKFLHPYPLSDKHFLVSCQLSQRSHWGIYLVDVFDNFVLLHEEPGSVITEPIPLRKTPKPPVVPSRIDPTRKDGVVFIPDIYTGDGLKGVRRGTVESLRLISYHYSYHGMGGQVDRVGMDGPWDVKQIIGTVPVEKDGSAQFRVPAYTPISVQPLDAEGKAVQLMRSWFTCMPGETTSCVGCHEDQNRTPALKTTIAAMREPSPIKPWYGPARGFSFDREVQPVLDKFCIGCHDGKTKHDGQLIADLTLRPDINMQGKSASYNAGAHFSPSYFELRKFVRSPTIESDAHMLSPREYHADTTKLIQLLKKGHHNVRLDDEAWDRLVTWIDLHAPAHGTWAEVCGEDRVESQRKRRAAMRKLYTGIEDNPEAVYLSDREPIVPIIPEPLPTRPTVKLHVPGWPFSPQEAAKRQTASAKTIELADGVSLKLSYIPAGEFVMGDADGHADEQPPTRVRVSRPFYLGAFEVTNEQYALFDKTHDSRLESGDFLQFSQRERGYAVNSPKQPALRVSWTQATEFCAWLSTETGLKFNLPTEGQWEYACRAGSDTSLWYGGLDADFSLHANVSDAMHQSLDTFGWGLPSGAIPPWRPADARFNDKYRVSAPVGAFGANPWGLHDMHGNVSEWTRSEYRSYPYLEDGIHNRATADGRKVVRGGSWYDRPKNCRSAHRWSYPADQRVFDVGFRVMCETPQK